MRARHADIRALLRANTDGMTAKEIADQLGAREDVVRSSLGAMPDTYIDRWDGPFRGQYVAVYCVVEVPEDCPHPEK